jgi:hypothetical protein
VVSGDAVSTLVVPEPPIPELKSQDTTQVQPLTSLTVIFLPLALPHQNPENYIRTCHHPCLNLQDTIVSLDMPLRGGILSSRTPTPPAVGSGLKRPYAPFSSRAEFEASEIIITNRLPPLEANKIYAGLASKLSSDDKQFHSEGYKHAYVWHSGQSKVSIKNYQGLLKTMERARKYVQPVRLMTGVSGLVSYTNTILLVEHS